MSMRVRLKQDPEHYPNWMKKNSPAKRAKARDNNRCIVCGIKDRTLVTDRAGRPLFLIYLHAAHISSLDPMFEEIEPIEGEVLRAMCPKHHREYDNTWKPREEEVEHQRRLHHILLNRWLPNTWLSQRFLTVV